MQLQEEISRLTRQHFDRAPDQCDDHQLYQAKRSGRDAVVFFETAPAL